MGSTDVASSISQNISEIFTKIFDWIQNVMWNLATFSGELWLMMPLWVKIILLMISLFILLKLSIFAYKNRHFWVEVIQGKY